MAGYKIIEVGQADIEKAVTKDSAHCVVAQALARTFPDARSIGVDANTIRFTRGHGETSKRYTYATPSAVYQYVVAFDAGDEIHPFTFRLYDDQRFIVRRRRTTDLGKKVDNAGAVVRRAERKAEIVAADPAASEAERTVARERAEVARAEHKLARAQAAAAPKQTTEKLPDVPAEEIRNGGGIAKRVSVTRGKRRQYGHREMRINNDPGPGDFRGPLDVDQS